MTAVGATIVVFLVVGAYLYVTWSVRAPNSLPGTAAYDAFWQEEVPGVALLLLMAAPVVGLFRFEKKQSFSFKGWLKGTVITLALSLSLLGFIWLEDMVVRSNPELRGRLQSFFGPVKDPGRRRDPFMTVLAIAAIGCVVYYLVIYAVKPTIRAFKNALHGKKT